MDKKNKNNIAKILLAFGVLASPMMLANQVSADNPIVNNTNTNNVDATATAQSDAVTTGNVIKENKEDKEQAKKEQAKEQAKEVATTAAKNTKAKATEESTTKENTATDETEATSQKEESSEEKEEAVVEGKEAFTLTEAQKQALKQAGFTDAEIEGIEKEIANQKLANANFDAEDFLNKKLAERTSAAENTPAAEEANALGISEELKPKAQKAGETEEDAITNVEITIGGGKNGANTEIVNPTALPERINGGNTDINLNAQVDFDIPEGTKAGRTFDFEVSDNVNLHGILVDEDKAVPVKYDGVEIATGTKLTDGRRGYRYTFNKNVDGLEDIRVRILYPLWIDPDKVPLNSEKETVTVKVAGKQASKDYKVEYENEVSEDKLGSTTLSGIANIEEVTSNSYEHIIYVNPRGDQGLINSNVTIENDVDHDSATFDEDVKNSVEVYRVKDSDKLPLSFGNNFEDGNYEKVENAEVKLVADGSKNKLVVKVNQGDAKNYFKDDAYDKSAYIIKYKGKRAPEKETKTKITYKADRRLLNGKKESLVTDGRFAWTWTNEIVFDDADAIALANKTYTLGDKVWIDADGNGSQGDNEVGIGGVKVILKGINMSDKETTTDANGNYKFEGLRNGEYTVEFKIPSGYAPTTVKAEGTTDINNSDASQAQGANVATATGVINGANNMNVDFGLIESKVKKGSFKETHVYKTLDYDGNVIEAETKTEAGKSTEGTKDEPYTSTKVDKAGYELVKVTADKGSEAVKISEDGKSVVPGNYVEDKNLSVTYEYVRRPGRFVEHHIYKTVDKEGNVVSTDDTVDVTEKDGKKIEGFSNESVNTDKKDRTGYTFKEATDIKLQNDESGKSYTNYVPGKTLEKTYIYTKTKEESVVKTGSFTEEHIYKTLDYDGKVVETSEPKQGEHKEGNKDVQYTTKANIKDGYKLVSVEASDKDAVIDSENGTAKTGNIVEGKDLKVTYTYEKQPGRFIEHHIYKTVDKDGKVVSTDDTVDVIEKDGKKIEGFSNESVNTDKKDRTGYTFKEATDIKLQNDESGKSYTNYVPGKTLEKTYIYTKTKEEPVVETGSFQEHHIYQTVDEQGKVISTDFTTDKEVKTGKVGEEYKTSKIDQPTYELKEVKREKGATANDNGSQATGKFVKDTKQEVTYIYKRVQKNGSFQEHHIYITKDQDGKITKTKTVDMT